VTCGTDSLTVTRFPRGLQGASPKRNCNIGETRYVSAPAAMNLAAAQHLMPEKRGMKHVHCSGASHNRFDSLVGSNLNVMRTSGNTDFSSSRTFVMLCYAGIQRLKRFNFFSPGSDLGNSLPTLEARDHAEACVEPNVGHHAERRTRVEPGSLSTTRPGGGASASLARTVFCFGLGRIVESSSIVIRNSCSVHSSACFREVFNDGPLVVHQGRTIEVQAFSFLFYGILFGLLVTLFLCVVDGFLESRALRVLPEEETGGECVLRLRGGGGDEDFSDPCDPEEDLECRRFESFSDCDSETDSLMYDLVYLCYFSPMCSRPQHTCVTANTHSEQDHRLLAGVLNTVKVKPDGTNLLVWSWLPLMVSRGVRLNDIYEHANHFKLSSGNLGFSESEWKNAYYVYRHFSNSQKFADHRSFSSWAIGLYRSAYDQKNTSPSSGRLSLAAYNDLKSKKTDKKSDSLSDQLSKASSQIHDSKSFVKTDKPVKKSFDDILSQTPGLLDFKKFCLSRRPQIDLRKYLSVSTGSAVWKTNDSGVLVMLPKGCFPTLSQEHKDLVCKLQGFSNKTDHITGDQRSDSGASSAGSPTAGVSAASQNSTGLGSVAVKGVVSPSSASIVPAAPVPGTDPSLVGSKESVKSMVVAPPSGKSLPPFDLNSNPDGSPISPHAQTFTGHRPFGSGVACLYVEEKDIPMCLEVCARRLNRRMQPWWHSWLFKVVLFVVCFAVAFWFGRTDFYAQTHLSTKNPLQQCFIIWLAVYIPCYTVESLWKIFASVFFREEYGFFKYRLEIVDLEAVPDSENDVRPYTHRNQSIVAVSSTYRYRFRVTKVGSDVSSEQSVCEDWSALSGEEFSEYYHFSNTVTEQVVNGLMTKPCTVVAVNTALVAILSSVPVNLRPSNGEYLGTKLMLCVKYLSERCSSGLAKDTLSMREIVDGVPGRS